MKPHLWKWEEIVSTNKERHLPICFSRCFHIMPLGCIGNLCKVHIKRKPQLAVYTCLNPVSLHCTPEHISFHLYTSHHKTRKSKTQQYETGIREEKEREKETKLTLLSAKEATDMFLRPTNNKKLLCRVEMLEGRYSEAGDLHIPSKWILSLRKIGLGRTYGTAFQSTSVSPFLYLRTYFTLPVSERKSVNQKEAVGLKNDI